MEVMKGVFGRQEISEGIDYFWHAMESNPGQSKERKKGKLVAQAFQG